MQQTLQFSLDTLIRLALCSIHIFLKSTFHKDSKFLVEALNNVPLLSEVGWKSLLGGKEQIKMLIFFPSEYERKTSKPTKWQKIMS